MPNKFSHKADPTRHWADPTRQWAEGNTTQGRCKRTADGTPSELVGLMSEIRQNADVREGRSV